MLVSITGTYFDTEQLLLMNIISLRRRRHVKYKYRVDENWDWAGSVLNFGPFSLIKYMI